MGNEPSKDKKKNGLKQEILPINADKFYRNSDQQYIEARVFLLDINSQSVYIFASVRSIYAGVIQW